MSRKKKEEPPQDIELPITPMLDMTFQLMTFFIFTFKPTRQEGQMSMNLPAPTDTKAASPVDVKPKEDPAPVEPPVNLTVIARSAGGAIGSLALKTTDATNDLGNDSNELYKTLKALRKDLDPSQDGIKIEADSKLKYACLIEIMDACMKAGFPQVGFAPPPDLAK